MEQAALQLASFAVMTLVVAPAARWLLDRLAFGPPAARRDFGRAIELSPLPDARGSAFAGERGGRPARAALGWERAGKGQHPVTTASVTAAIALPPGLRVSSQAERGLLNLVSGDDIQLGDPVLDAGLWVVCPNPAAALRLLRAPGVAPALLRFFGRNPGARLEDGALHVRLAGHAGPQALSAVLDELVEVLRQLEAGRAEPPAPDPAAEALVRRYRASTGFWAAVGVPVALVGARLVWLAMDAPPAAEGVGAAPVLAVAGFGLGFAGLGALALGPRCPACGARPQRSPVSGMQPTGRVVRCLSCGVGLR